MKSKQLVILIALAAVLGGAVWFLKKESKNAWSDTSSGAGGKVIDFPINDVARLTIQSSAGKVNLLRKDDAWTVEERAGYPANFERVGNLLRKLWDLKTVQDVKVGPSQMARFELVEPDKGAGTGTRVDFKDKDGKPIGGLLVGKQFMKKSDAGFAEGGEFPAGRYVMPPGGSNVSLVSDSLDDVDPKPESWLKRDFFKIESPSSVTLAGPTDAQKWKLTRESASADWKLEDAKGDEKADPAKASQIAGVLAYPSFTDVLNPDAKPDDTGLDKPAIITFETFDGFKYVLKVGKETGTNRPVTVEVSAQLAKERTPGKDEKPEDKTKLDDEFKAKLKRLEEKLAAEKKFEGRPFLIAKATLDQIIKDRATLLAETKPEPAPGTPPAPGAPPVPNRPGAKAPSVSTPPISVTTPPVAVPPLPGEPARTPPKPGEKPVTVTTPPVTVPPAKQPQKIRTLPGTPEKPATPANSTPPPAKPGPAN
jgi:hypothetical protein